MSKAAELVKQFEGLRLKVYADSAGLPTVGYGHLIQAGDRLKLGQTITQERADAFLEADLETAVAAVKALVKVPLNENQEAALISLVFNIGVGAFKKSTLLRRLNTGDYDDASAQFSVWVNAGGRRIQGLVNRRNAERALFDKPV